MILFYFMAALMALGGLYQIIYTAQKKGKQTGYLIGAAMLGWGVALFLVGRNSLQHAVSFSLFTIGLFLVALDFWLLKTMFDSNISVPAELVEYNIRTSRGVRYSSPVMRYYYNGQEYQNATPQTFRWKPFKKRCQEGETYEVLISEKAPHRCYLVKRIRGVDLVVLMMGFLMIGMSILVIWSM